MKRSVLIIDDEVDLCALISNYLEKKDYKVVCAHTLADGYRKLASMHPDVLLLDNNLPDGLGWKEANNIHYMFPEMRIALLSAYEASMYAITGDGFELARFEKPVSLLTIERYVA